MSEPLLCIQNISKRFPGVKALDDVSFDVHPGDVHVLMGENGAGKSTLMKILSGAYQPDEGSLTLAGEDVSFRDPIQARDHGIGMIYQELTVLPNLSVGRNIMLGQEPMTALWQVNWRKLYADAQAVLDELDLALDVRAPLQILNIAERQMVEIARSVQQRPRLMIMDEPTSALGKHEEEVLFALIDRLKARGVSIIYISHRMDEVFRLADTITVLRDGQHMATRPAGEFSRESLIELMVGRNVDVGRHDGVSQETGEARVTTYNLSVTNTLHDISFDLHAGEVLGVAGLVGAGQTQLAEVLFGLRQADAGTLSLDGNPINLPSPQAAISAGIAYVPEDRKDLGLVLMMSVQNNLTLAGLEQHTKAGLLNLRALKTSAQTWVKRLGIRTASLGQQVDSLSGGNQQKVVLAKWLSLQPRVLILNEPTRGIDVGAKVDVHKLIRDIAASGVAVLMISSELPEVLSVSDRIMVMWQGHVTGILHAESASEEQVLALAFGEQEQAA
ncbi:MAG: sugar ABC transporter ATP-binding protein [Deinococcota bacterium]